LSHRLAQTGVVNQTIEHGLHIVDRLHHAQLPGIGTMFKLHGDMFDIDKPVPVETIICTSAAVLSAVSECEHCSLDSLGSRAEDRALLPIKDISPHNKSVFFIVRQLCGRQLHRVLVVHITWHRYKASHRPSQTNLVQQNQSFVTNNFNLSL
jgi:hypothetical protein